MPGPGDSKANWTEALLSGALSLVGVTDKKTERIQYNEIHVVTVGVQEVARAERISGQGLRGGFTEAVTFELGLKDE